MSSHPLSDPSAPHNRYDFLTDGPSAPPEPEPEPVPAQPELPPERRALPRHRWLDTVLGLLFFLFLRVESWACSIPAWLTLLLHFTSGLSLAWFFATLAAWLIAGVLRYLVIRFARWSVADPPQKKENKNPYSRKK
ncbi:MAG: hypothetical protein IKI50_04500 [Clostridia bacterium]|nr:hypothetical protein [Clostridia bacterium]